MTPSPPRRVLVVRAVATSSGSTDLRISSTAWRSTSSSTAVPKTGAGRRPRGLWNAVGGTGAPPGRRASELFVHRGTGRSCRGLGSASSRRRSREQLGHSHTMEGYGISLIPSGVQSPIRHPRPGCGACQAVRPLRGRRPLVHRGWTDVRAARDLSQTAGPGRWHTLAVHGNSPASAGHHLTLPTDWKPRRHAGHCDRCCRPAADRRPRHRRTRERRLRRRGRRRLSIRRHASSPRHPESALRQRRSAHRGVLPGHDHPVRAVPVGPAGDRRQRGAHGHRCSWSHRPRRCSGYTSG